LPFHDKCLLDAADLERLDEQLLNVHVQLTKLDVLVDMATRNADAVRVIAPSAAATPGSSTRSREISTRTVDNGRRRVATT